MAIDASRISEGTIGKQTGAGHPSPERGGRPRLYILDGLRLVAAAGVMLYHFTGRRNIAWNNPDQVFPGFQRITAYGWLGVEFFFLISGFVICMSAWGRPLPHFFRSRVVRLFPAYWFSVIATAVVLYLLPYPADGFRRPTQSTILTNLTMVQSPLNTPSVDLSYWTLWSEMRFYLIFAVVVWMGLTYRRVLNFAWLWLLGAILAPNSGSPLFQTVANPDFAPLFIGGIALYIIRREGRRRAEPWALLGISWLFEQHAMLNRMTSEVTPNRLSWTVTVGVLTLIYLIMIAVALGWLDWVKWRALTVAGAMSYPVYLMNQHIGLRMLRLGRDHLAAGWVVTVDVAAILLLAWLVQRYVERPGAKWLRSVMAGSGSTR